MKHKHDKIASTFTNQKKNPKLSEQIPSEACSTIQNQGTS
jgi:hypothetical protein